MDKGRIEGLSRLMIKTWRIDADGRRLSAPVWIYRCVPRSDYKAEPDPMWYPPCRCRRCTARQDP